MKKCCREAKREAYQDALNIFKAKDHLIHPEVRMCLEELLTYQQEPHPKEAETK